jgi:hypothetical protein
MEAEAKEAEIEKAESQGTLTVREKIAKRKEALRLKAEAEKAKEKVNDEKHAAQEAIENGTPL